MSEFGVDNRPEGSVEKSLAAYKDALGVAVELPPTVPLRLGLALNFSVFCYEILGSHDRAVHVAQTALDDTRTGLDDLSETHYRDATSIMQLLRDNINLWTSDKEGTFHTCDIGRLDWFTGRFAVKAGGGNGGDGGGSSLVKDTPVPEGDESMSLLGTLTGKPDSERKENNDRDPLVKPGEDVS